LNLRDNNKRAQTTGLLSLREITMLPFPVF